jgi:hypothetical protein
MHWCPANQWRMLRDHQQGGQGKQQADLNDMKDNYYHEISNHTVR